MSSKSEFVVEAEKRKEHGTREARRLRRQGKLPAVMYGHGKAAVSLTISSRAGDQLLQHGGVVTLAIAGRKRPVTAVVKEVQRDAITAGPLHFDFREVRADELITTSVPLVPTGEAAGQQHGGQLEQMVHQLTLECLPGNLPDMVRVDISGLDLDDVMHVADLELPEGVKAAVDPELAVFQVRLPRVEAADEEEAVAEGEEGAVEGEEGAAPAEGEPEGEEKE